jgi:hypothetical protein
MAYTETFTQHAVTFAIALAAAAGFASTLAFGLFY